MRKHYLVLTVVIAIIVFLLGTKTVAVDSGGVHIAGESKSSQKIHPSAYSTTNDIIDDPHGWRWQHAVTFHPALFMYCLLIGWLLAIVAFVVRVLLKSRGVQFHQPTDTSGPRFSTWKYHKESKTERIKL